MTSKQLRDLLANQPDLALEILAVDPMIYLVRLQSAEAGALLQKSAGKNWVFPSFSAAKAHLHKLGARKVRLIHHSAYGEMIGSAGSLAHSAPALTELNIAVDMTVDDDALSG